MILENNIKVKRKRLSKRKSLLHTYPVKDVGSILKGDIVELSKGRFIDVCNIDLEYTSFDGVSLLNINGRTKKIKDREWIMNKCIDIYSDSDKKEKNSAMELIKYLEHLFPY